MRLGKLMVDDRVALRERIRANYLADEAGVIARCLEVAALDRAARETITQDAVTLVQRIRDQSDPRIMESFLAEYGLSTQEGIALMCLAEAMLRVPDAATLDALIYDKIAPSDWGLHLGKSSSPLVNASTWALLLTGRVLDDGDAVGLVGNVRGLVRRLGEPVVRQSVSQSMKILGRQFVLGATIEDALERAEAVESRGFTYSYDMLGEAARTAADAERYYQSYAAAIDAIAARALHGDLRRNPGISVKLSALYPRFEFGHRAFAVPALIERAGELARRASAARIGFNIDAEEADRIDMSLDVFEGLLMDPSLADWDGLGIVVQAYGRRALPVLDWLEHLVNKLDRRIMVRLVKGAYWDAEIKRAQTLGLSSYPVFTRKINTDVCYLACARRLLSLADRIYPQFATHNAQTAIAVMHMASEAGVARDAMEFQRLHGMGENLYEQLHGRCNCRIYAPVGAHEDLLAYLVRRLLENGANSSFVNQIVDERISTAQIARDPVTALRSLSALGAPVASRSIAAPGDLYAPERQAAKGWDLTDPTTVAQIDAARERFRSARWQAAPVLAGGTRAKSNGHNRFNPANPDDLIGTVIDATPADVDVAVQAARAAYPDWSARTVTERAAYLERIADLFEANAPELFALLAREAGKTLADAVAEVREAVDFCRYYAAQARTLARTRPGAGRGVFVCISPWNFPLAIFTGQITAALVTGNTVLAKPAEQSPLIAARAFALFRKAGIPDGVAQLLPGDGASIGAALVSHRDIDGVCFTGSTETAQAIHRGMAANAPPAAPLIAETGGINAMIVDSTALPEQAVRDILASAFQSAGQRCSALRMLYVQKDVEARTLDMLRGAMDTLRVGDPWLLSTDVGPVIDREAQASIDDYCSRARGQERELTRIDAPESGWFVGPTVFRVSGIAELEGEVFGPVLHVASFDAEALPSVIDDINARGYGLTLGVHTRIDDRVQQVVGQARVGNIYVNRNQIGAVVGSQPFGGEGLSGTGPKAGGPLYLARFRREDEEPPASEAHDVRPEAAAASIPAITRALTDLARTEWASRSDRLDALAHVARVLDSAMGGGDALLAAIRQAKLDPIELPGPTGESNRLMFFPRGTALCLGEVGAPRALRIAVRQAVLALTAGNSAVVVAPGAAMLTELFAARHIPLVGIDGSLAPNALRVLEGVAVVAARGVDAELRPLRKALAARDGAIVPLVSSLGEIGPFLIERTLCVDTTAAGGNATLLAASDRGEAAL